MSKTFSDQYQTDLFSHGKNAGAKISSSALIDALLANKINEASEELSRLEEIEPDHKSVKPAKILIRALRLPPPTGLDEAIERQASMLTFWIPASENLFGSARKSILNPIWIEIGQALEPLPYDPTLPDKHASFAYQCGEAWLGVKKSILAVSDHLDDPILMGRLASAYSKLGDNIKSMNIWFFMCQKFPEDFEQQINQDSFLDQKLKRIWNHAIGLNLEPNMSPEWFPAWTMLADPGSAKWLETPSDNNKLSESFRLVKELLAHQQVDQKGLQLRRDLHNLNPELLKRYIEDVIETEK